jgi:hypothetical protein
MVARTEDLLSLEARDAGRGGREHARCCHTPVGLSLAEAVVLTTR